MVASPPAPNSSLYSSLAPPLQQSLESRFYNPSHSTSLSEVWNPQQATTTATGSTLNDFVQPTTGRAQNGFLVSPSQNIWHNERGAAAAAGLGATGLSSNSPIWRNELYANHNQHSTSPQPREFQPFGDHINLLNSGSQSLALLQPTNSNKHNSSEDLVTFNFKHE